MSVILVRRTSLLTTICQWYWWGEQAYKQQYVSDIDEENKLTNSNMSMILMRRTSLLTTICQWYWWGEQAY